MVQGTGFCFSTAAGGFSLLKVYTRFETHPTIRAVRSGPTGKVVGLKPDDPQPRGSEVNNTWIYSFTLLCTITTWSLNKHRDCFTLSYVCIPALGRAPISLITGWRLSVRQLGGKPEHCNLVPTWRMCGVMPSLSCKSLWHYDYFRTRTNLLSSCRIHGSIKCEILSVE